MAIFNSYVKLPEGTHPEYLQLRRFHYGSGTNPGRTSSKQRSATPRRQLRHAKRGCSLILSIVGKPSVLQGRTVFGGNSSQLMWNSIFGGEIYTI